jgi:hypothetical protein
MSTVNTIDVVTDWANENICQKVKLKLPDDKRVDATYNAGYKLVNPDAFPLYVPAKDRMPPDVVAPIPSLCVQLMSGRDTLTQDKGFMRLRFCFSTWDPGIHGPDIFNPAEGAEPLAYEQWNGTDAVAHYERRSEGWRDVWNFVDTALRVLESAEYIGTKEKYRIMVEDGIDYGPVTEEDNAVDFYPYWFAWVAFNLQYGISRNFLHQHDVSAYEELL